eukprot:8811505-Alexandrium_andersonii.AAC.1
MAFLVVRSRRPAAVLRALRVDSAAGPDGLPARSLRVRSAEIALPFATLARVVFLTESGRAVGARVGAFRSASGSLRASRGAT